MRPKVVWSVIAVAVLLLGLGYIEFRKVNSNTPVEGMQRAQATPTPQLHANKRAERRHDAPATRVEVSHPTAETEIAEMNQALLEVNEKTLPLLCSKLSATERQVRQAAVSNLVLLADRDAIPALSETLERVTDSGEKASILSAIEFLKLPAYNELVANGTMQPLGKTPPNTSRSESETSSSIGNAAKLKPGQTAE